MNLGWLTKVRFVLTRITDWLTAGRAAGLWDKKGGPSDFQGGVDKTPDDYRK